jgi:hypothetical protein
MKLRMDDMILPDSGLAEPRKIRDFKTSDNQYFQGINPLAAAGNLQY